MSDLVVVCKYLRIVYGELLALDTFNVEIAEGEFVVLLGPSGSGKTTVLSMPGGYTEPTEGQIFIRGDDVTQVRPAQRPTATVIQNYALFPHMRYWIWPGNANDPQATDNSR